MEYQVAQYIIDYFPRLMTELEKEAFRQFSISSKLGTPASYEDQEKFERRKELFKEKFGYKENPDLLRMIENGYEALVIKTAKRICKDSPNEFFLNKCPNCDFLTRTPYAKQCRKCSHSWHNEVGGELQFDTSFRIAGSSYLWIVGELLRGHIQTGYKIDLTNFQINIIAEIKKMETYLKPANGIKKDLINLGIAVSIEEEEQIKQYLTKSLKTILILKK